MRHLDLLNEFRELIGQLRHEVEAAGAMQQYDTHKVAEQVVCGLFKELYGYSGMRNLNAEQSNFPGIDLADDDARIAVQVTATAGLSKVKGTLEKFITHRLHHHYGRLLIYILTQKQASYSQAAVNSTAGDDFSLSVADDIFDYRDFSAKAAEVQPKKLQAAINILKSYLRGVPVGLADKDVDPPLQPEESLLANLIHVYFPVQLSVAQLNSDIKAVHKGNKYRNSRDAIRSFCQSSGMTVPSAYVDHGGSLVTFFDLAKSNSPYHLLIESGTEEALTSKEFWEIDQDHERVFKSLLRFSLQHRLYLEWVYWYHEEKQFVFLPKPDDGDERKESWHGSRQATRSVFVRQYNKKDSSKIYLQRHLSFAVDFHHIADDWLMSITPNWFFSYGKSFKKSGFSHENLSWIKKQENNRAVQNHFRFIAEWLKAIDQHDLFSESSDQERLLSFGDYVAFPGSPHLDESKWAPLPEIPDDVDLPSMPGLFG